MRQNIFLAHPCLSLDVMFLQMLALLSHFYRATITGIFYLILINTALCKNFRLFGITRSFFFLCSFHQNRSMRVIIGVLPSLISEVERMPAGLKDRFLHLMSKRGLVTDQNIHKVISLLVIQGVFKGIFRDVKAK